MSSFFKPLNLSKPELFPTLIREWQWYQFASESPSRWLWYTIPRKRLVHPVACEGRPVHIQSQAWVPHSPVLWAAATDARWGRLLYVLSAGLVIIIIVLVRTVYRKVHDVEWFDMLTGMEMFEFVAML